MSVVKECVVSLCATLARYVTVPAVCMRFLCKIVEVV